LSTIASTGKQDRIGLHDDRVGRNKPAAVLRRLGELDVGACAWSSTTSSATNPPVSTNTRCMVYLSPSMAAPTCSYLLVDRSE
jgi:hypothetical protein